MRLEAERFTVDCEKVYASSNRHRGISTRDYLARNGYSEEFAHHCVATILSLLFVSRAAQLALPMTVTAMSFTVGLSAFKPVTAWRTIAGGTQEYVGRIAAGFRDRVRLATAVQAIERRGRTVVVRDVTGRDDTYDRLVMAIPADRALEMLTDASDEERRLLGAVRYEPATSVLHRDRRFMPEDPDMWATFVYVAEGGSPYGRPYNTYYLPAFQDWIKEDVFMTIDPPEDAIAPDDTFASIRWSHLVYDVEHEARVPAYAELQGKRRTHYCGAYTLGPSHEMAFTSGLNAAAAIAAL
jgi:predicted NAD/FAD-binding protein